MHKPVRFFAITFVVASAVLLAQTGGTSWIAPTLGEVDGIYPDIEALYLDLHRNPELAFEETDEVRLELSVRTFAPEVRTRTLAAIRRIAKGEADAAGAPREPVVTAPAVARPPVFNDPRLILRLAGALKKTLGEQTVVEMPLKMTSEDFAEYGAAGVPSALLHIGAVNPAKLAEARRTGIPVPAPHSPEWAPERAPTLKAAIRAEATALLELFRGN